METGEENNNNKIIIIIASVCICQDMTLEIIIRSCLLIQNMPVMVWPPRLRRVRLCCPSMVAVPSLLSRSEPVEEDGPVALYGPEDQVPATCTSTLSCGCLLARSSPSCRSLHSNADDETLLHDSGQWRRK